MDLKQIILCLIILIACSNTSSADVSFGKIEGGVDIKDAYVAGQITDTGQNTLKVVLEGSGPVVIGIDFSRKGEAQHFTVQPMTQAIQLEPGESQVVEFTFIPSDVKGDYEGVFTIIASTYTDSTAEYKVHYRIKDSELLNANSVETPTTNFLSPMTTIVVLFIVGLIVAPVIKAKEK